MKKAQQYFKELDSDNTTIISRVAGKLMSSSIDINSDDKKNKNNYK